MAHEAYMIIEGTKQGKFKGTSTRGVHKDKIPVLSFDYAVQSPRDVATGQPTGFAQHQPVTATIEWGAASPQIFQALTTNEILKTVSFEFYRTTPDGKEDMHYTIKLTNGTVSNQRMYIERVRHSEKSDTLELEDISFTFDQIDVESKWGKAMASDSWTKGRQ